jgi:iron(III) transport system ATP-binding protein
VLVTHDQEEALSLADSVAVLRDGTIVQQGTPAELYERPADERLARFLGAVNVLYASFLGETAQTPLGPLPLSAAVAGDGAGAVILRPEQIEVLPLSRAGEDGVAGRVERCRYYGHDALLQIRAAGEELLVARVAGGEALAEGTPVRVRARGSVTPLG